MDLDQKIKWLQKNYKDYPKHWYEENPKRTLAIYSEMNTRYINDIMDELTMKREEAIHNRITLCEQSYLSQYGVTIDEDEHINGRKYVIDRISNLEDQSYKQINIP